MGAIHQALLSLPVVGGGAVDVPSTIANIWDWWEPSRDGYSDTDTVDLLTGQFAGKTFARAAGNRPTYVAAGPNGVGVMNHSNGGGQALEGPDGSALTAGHVFLVVKGGADPSASGRGTPWRIGSDGTNPDLYTWTTGDVYMGAGSTVRKFIANPAAATTSWRVLEVSSITNEFIVKLDGTQLGSTINPNTVGFTTQMQLGAGPSSATFFGQIAGLYIYSAKLSAGDRTTLINYINTRFGLSSS
jgi:hypothetical protein